MTERQTRIMAKTLFYWTKYTRNALRYWRQFLTPEEAAIVANFQSQVFAFEKAIGAAISKRLGDFEVAKIRWLK